MRRLFTLSVLSVITLLLATPTAPAEEAEHTWKASVAVKVITPSEPMWMAGYANRNKPAEGKVHDLHSSPTPR